MHYIRFLKPPRLQASPPALSAKITVTTDLGESFLFEDTMLVAEVLGEDGLVIGKSRSFLWRGANGMRALEIEVSLLNGKTWSKKLRMLVRPEDTGAVLAVRSPPLDATERLAERVLDFVGKELVVCEEMGESIARHIWDAGLVLSSYIASLSQDQPHIPRTLPSLPMLECILKQQDSHVLELGAGCGIVGITLSTHFSPTSTLLTDLPEASAILTHNLPLLPAASSTLPSHQVLDWSHPLPSTVSSITWNLVLVADCTYNPDMVPDLVKTLTAIAAVSPDVYVLLAMKVRHESEMVFFDLMEGAGWMVVESAVLNLLVRGAEDEEVRVFGFAMKERNGEVS